MSDLEVPGAAEPGAPAGAGGARPSVALVTWNYDTVQGVGRCVVELTRRLATRYRLCVLATQVGADPPAGVELIRIPRRVRPRHLEEWEFFLRTGSYLRRRRFDLVHLHFPAWYPAPLFTCHAVSPAAIQAWARFPPEAREPVGWRQRVRFQVQSPLFSFHLRDPRTRVATVSERARQDLVEHFGRRPEEVRIVPNGADLERFHPSLAGQWRTPVRRELGLAEDRFVLLLVGNNLRMKGGRSAIRVLERLPGSAVLIVVGDNSRRSIPGLESVAARLETAGRLFFVGQREEVWRYYGAADALLFPSLYESFGLVLLEGMGAGLPAVTARTVALADELIRDGENGFLVDRPWDIEGMAQRVERLMRDPELRRRTGTNARATVEPYTWDRYAARTDAIYRELLTTGPIRSRR